MDSLNGIIVYAPRNLLLQLLRYGEESFEDEGQKEEEGEVTGLSVSLRAAV
jgi:hypothetical protein